jgi:hypothetical protein
VSGRMLLWIVLGRHPRDWKQEKQSREAETKKTRRLSLARHGLIRDGKPERAQSQRELAGNLR